MVIGTSICDMALGHEEIRLPGITGVVRDGILPGLFGYEAGQAAVGDMLAWFVDTLRRRPVGLRRTRASAAGIAPGETGLLALDWWNGNRTILADADLTGAIFGLTMQSTPAEIYRALLESIAFGNRRIMDNFDEHGMRLDRIVACGGIAEKSPLTMQLRRRHERPSRACSRLQRDPGARSGAVRCRRRRQLQGHRRRDRRRPAGDRADLHPGPRRDGRPTSGCTRSTEIYTSCSAVPGSTCCTG